MLVTIKDIARELGINHSTVSRALHGKDGVSPELRTRIQATAERLGYTPNALARSLVTRQSRSIAFIVPDFSNPFFVEIANEVNHIASARGFTTLLADNLWQYPEEIKQIRAMVEKRVDGIIIKSFGDEDSSLAELGIPVVKLNHSADPRLSSLDIDNSYGGFIATEHLILGGYRHIAYIGSNLDPQTGNDRLAGYFLALRQYRRFFDSRLVSRGDYSFESGARCYEWLLRTGLPFDAVVCENDMIALGVYDRAMRDGKSIPDQFGLIGFDDMFFAGLSMINLTTIAQPKRQIGEKAVNLLLDLIMKPEKPPTQTIVYKPQLIVRSTTRPIY